MGNRSSTWQRVSKSRLCPVCDHPDWCLFVGPEDSSQAAICHRVESPKRCGEAGWLHVLRDDGPVWTPMRRAIHIALTHSESISGAGVDLAKLATDFRTAILPAALERLATVLGLTAESLVRLGIGWSKQHRAWTFPMSDTAGKVLGIRLRCAGGKKLSVRGGHEGLFIAEGLKPAELLLVTEGPTNCAALLDLGFSAVGRPSCTGGVKLVVDLVRQRKPAQVVIVADGDAPGQRGAENLAVLLVAYAASVRIITPPAGIKDARAWKQRGATAAGVLAVIGAAPVRKLVVKTSVRKRKAGAKHGR